MQPAAIDTEIVGEIPAQQFAYELLVSKRSLGAHAGIVVGDIDKNLAGRHLRQFLRIRHQIVDHDERRLFAPNLELLDAKIRMRCDAHVRRGASRARAGVAVTSPLRPQF